MAKNLVGIAVLMASLVLCSSSVGSASPWHAQHRRGACLRAARVYRDGGVSIRQGRSVAPAFLIAPAYGYPLYQSYQNLPPHLQPCTSLDDCDRKAFDESGTRGRMGLGADPAHPEGPGNVSD